MLESRPEGITEEMITFRRASLACHQGCRSMAERPATRPFMRWRFDAANSGHGVRPRPV